MLVFCSYAQIIYSTKSLEGHKPFLLSIVLSVEKLPLLSQHSVPGVELYYLMYTNNVF